MGVTKQEGEKIHTLKRLIDIALALILTAAVLFAILHIKKDFNKIEQSSDSDDIIISSDGSSELSNDHSILVSDSIDNEKVHQGPLILVNDTAEYKWDESGLANILDVCNEIGDDCYTVLDGNVKIRSSAVLNLNNMLRDFSKETGNTDIRVDGAYRSVDEQQEIYDSAEDQSAVSKPGTSDYHAGYSVDLNVVDEDGISLDFDGTGDYEWFEKNCHKYGFILRCPKGKEAITGQQYRPWHFRYVGAVHAAYIKENDLCLEEYITKLRSCPYNGEHLEASDSNGKKYEIYYVPADMSATLTSAAVPSEGKYEISGDNSEGFIITMPIDNSQSQESETAPNKTEPSGQAASDAAEPSETE